MANRSQSETKKHSSLKKHIYPAWLTVLAVIIAVTTVLGIRFAISPVLERIRLLDFQAELLRLIEEGDGVLTVDAGQLAVPDEEYDIFILDTGAATNTDSDVPIHYTGTSEYTPPETLPDSDLPEIEGIGILTIEKIGARLPVTFGASSEQLRLAVGHVPQTPQIGSAGNAVIAGHRSYTYGLFFNRLDELAIGDVIRYRPIGGEAMSFEVFETLIVLPGDASAFYQPEDEHVITLLTCTPIRTATHRLLVRARLALIEN